VTVVYMRGGITSRVMAADSLYGEFYDIYSVSTEYFGCTPVYIRVKEFLILSPCTPNKMTMEMKMSLYWCCVTVRGTERTHEAVSSHVCSGTELYRCPLIVRSINCEGCANYISLTC
jgi:hypothetical protein